MLRPQLPLLFLLMLLSAVSCSHSDVEECVIGDGASFEMRADGIGVGLSADSSRISLADVALSEGMLRPEESMAMLRSVLKDGRLPQPEFPKVTDVGAWATAAWEIYCMTGSESWIKEAYDVLTKSLLRQYSSYGVGLETPLRGGQPQWVDEAGSFYPKWMKPMDRYSTVSTAVNASTATAYAVCSQMAGVLRLYAESEHQLSFTTLRNAINDRLWIPDMQRYGQYLYGQYYPVLSAVSDSRANALCVLGGIATPEMSEAVVASLPLCRDGVPDVFPQISPAAGEFTPLTQALFALSAAKVRNPQAFVLSVSSLVGANPDRNHSSEWPAVVLKGFFGMNPTPSGIYFKPMVPVEFEGDKVLKGFRYREAELDIVMRGTGDRIASFLVDSVSVRIPRIDSSLKGRHRIEIKLSGNDQSERGINVVERENILSLPQLRWGQDGRDLKIMDFDPDLRYGIYIDGVMVRLLDRDSYRLPSPDVSVTAIVPVGKSGKLGFSPRSHVYAPGQTEITVNASSVTPRRPPLHFIKDRRTADNYIELAARHNTRITCYANAPIAGDYFLTVGYSNGSERDALRTLSINDRDVATLICPAVSPDDWIAVHPSNTVVVSLREGPNKIALTYIGGTILLNKITLLKKTS